ncbi:MAG: hypothetical protein AAFX02_02070 [Pseudomonadota bacterium]
MSTGQFINFLLKYKSGTTPDGLDNPGQANAILTKAKALIDAGQVGVAIIYSANEGQTDALEKAYGAGLYSAHIGGANQAEVMHDMEGALGTDAWSELQLKMRIAPITTIPFTSDPATIIASDLKRIEDYLKNGWAILGWQNQGTVGDPDHPYAIGGGVAAHLLPAIDQQIQDGLKKLAAAYPES